MKNVSLKYHRHQPRGRTPTARERALARWFGNYHVATFGLLLAKHPRYPVVQGGGA